MTILQMRYLDSVVRNQSITKAAEELFVSQPWVSQSLMDIEKEYNIKFFDRKNRKLILTEDGEYFWDKMRSILEEVDELSEELIYRGKNHGNLKIGVTPMFGSFLFPKVFNNFHENYPKIAVSMVEAGSLGLMKSLEKKDITACFIVKGAGDIKIDTDRFNYYIVGKTKFLFTVDKNNKLFNKKRVDIEELKDFPLVLLSEDSYQNKKINNTFKENNVRMNLGLVTNQVNVMKNLISQSEMGGFFIKEFIESDKNFSHMELNPPLDVDVLLVWLKESTRNNVLSDFIRCIKAN